MHKSHVTNILKIYIKKHIETYIKKNVLYMYIYIYISRLAAQAGAHPGKRSTPPGADELRQYARRRVSASSSRGWCPPSGWRIFGLPPTSSPSYELSLLLRLHQPKKEFILSLYRNLYTKCLYTKIYNFHVFGFSSFIFSRVRIKRH